MRKLFTLPLIAMVLMAVIGCTPEKTARDTIATFSGAVAQAQQEYLASCSANPAQKECATINKAVHAQNAAITSLETYCQFALNAPLPPVGTKCNPVKSAGDGLKSAIANLNQLMGEVKALTGKASAGAGVILMYGPGGYKATIIVNGSDEPAEPYEPSYPVQPEPWSANVSAGALALALLALKQLLANLKLGKYGEVASEAIDAVQGGITELEQYQGTEVTMEQLEGMRLHLLWPDPLPADPATAVSGTAPSK